MNSSAEDHLPTYKIIRNYFDPKPLEEVLKVSGKRVPRWLGDFDFEIYGTVYGKKPKNLPYRIKQFINQLHLDLCPDQEFNTYFLQKYPTGHSVSRHRDPKNNIGYTIIAVLGDFTGATTTLHLPESKVSFTLRSGDVLILACTIDGVQGVPHQVSEVTSGTRYAIIMNTVEQEEKDESLSEY